MTITKDHGTSDEAHELYSVMAAQAGVNRYLKYTRTFDVGDWIRCMSAWNDELDFYGIKDDGNS